MSAGWLTNQRKERSSLQISRLCAGPEAYINYLSVEDSLAFPCIWNKSDILGLKYGKIVKSFPIPMISVVPRNVCY